MLRLKLNIKTAQTLLDIHEIKRDHDEESIIKNKYHFAIKNYIKYNGLTPKLCEQAIKYNYDLSSISSDKYNLEDLLIKNNTLQESLMSSIIVNNLSIFAKTLKISNIVKLITTNVNIMTILKQNYDACDIYKCLVKDQILAEPSNLKYVCNIVGVSYLENLFKYYIDNSTIFDCKYFYDKIDSNNVKYLIKGYNDNLLTEDDINYFSKTMTMENSKRINAYIKSLED